MTKSVGEWMCLYNGRVECADWSKIMNFDKTNQWEL